RPRVCGTARPLGRWADAFGSSHASPLRALGYPCLDVPRAGPLFGLSTVAAPMSDEAGSVPRSRQTFNAPKRGLDAEMAPTWRPANSGSVQWSDERSVRRDERANGALWDARCTARRGSTAAFMAQHRS